MVRLLFVVLSWRKKTIDKEEKYSSYDYSFKAKKIRRRGEICHWQGKLIVHVKGNKETIVDGQWW